MTPTANTVYNIQALRAFAALIVVVFKVTRSAGTDDPNAWVWTAGAFGVDVFFVISGFIIMHVSDRWAGQPWSFMKGRFVRIMPIYWISTFVMLLPLIVLGISFAGIAAIEPAELIRNALLIPTTNESHRIFYVGAAWTLVYEMMFYALFAVGIFFRSRVKTLIFVTGVFLALTSARYAFGLTNGGLLDYYTDPVVYMFASGALLGLLYPHMKTIDPNLSKWGGAGLMLTGGVLWLTMTQEPADMGDARVLIWGVPAFLVVAGALLLEAAGKVVKNRLVQEQGDASYSLYMFHDAAILAVFGVARALGLVDDHKLVIGLCTVSLGIVASILTYRWLERPLTEALNKRFVRRAMPTRTAFSAPSPASQ